MISGAYEVLADWIVPVDGEPFRNARMSFQDGVITAIERSSDLPGADSGKTRFLLPGFINLHSHLDYSLAGYYCQPLFEWIVNLVGKTRGWEEEQFRKSANHGAYECLKNGTTFLVDSSYSGASAYAMAEAGLKGICGLEIFGVDESACQFFFSDWISRYNRLSSEVEKLSGDIQLTVSPHAPYTVSPALFRKCLDWARTKNLPVLTHLAESESENQWFTNGGGPIDTFLKRVLPQKNATNIVSKISWKAINKTSVESLFDQGLLNNSLLCAHSIHTTEKDIALLKESGVSIAHCPRSNTNLENGRFKLEEYLDYKIALGLGTDSLASCQSLSMLDEARSMIDLQSKHLPNGDDLYEKALKLITLDAAKTLSLDSSIGSLRVGKQADFLVLEYSDNPSRISGSNIYHHIFDPLISVKEVYINGKKLYEKQ